MSAGFRARVASWMTEPSTDADPEVLRRSLAWQRVAVVVALVFFIALSMARGQVRASVVHLVALALVALLSQRFGRAGASAKGALLGVILADLIVVSFFTGQNAALSPWFLLLLPVLAHGDGIAATVRWSVIAAVAMLVIDLSVHVLVLPPEFVPSPAHYLPVRLALLALFAAFSITTRRVHNAQVMRIADKERENRAQASALRDARDEALAAARAKAQFLANMSHEIRTPLAGVMGIMEQLSKTALDKPQRELVDLARECGRTLHALTNDVLDLSKLEAGRLSLDERSFSLRELVNGVLAVARVLSRDSSPLASLPPSAEAAAPRETKPRIVLEARWVGEPPDLLLGDDLRVRQVLTNLVGNAVKFTREGTVTIVVGPYENDLLHVEVRDTGIGISPENLEKLFKPFVQGDDSHARKYGGTGLGLVISKSLVERMGGTLRVESEPNKGSSFRFRLRLPRAPHDESDLVPPSARGAPSSLAQRSELRALPNMRILVADDNALNQRLIGAMLEELGQQPEFASDGQEALDMLERAPFDVVLMDMQMPVVDGVTATRKIRARDGAQPKIVMVSANVLEEYWWECQSAGVDDFLARPFTQRELRTMLARHQPHHIDTSRVRELAAICKPGELRELITDYFNSVAKLRAELDAAAATRDAKRARRAAHDLKANCATFGAVAVARLAAEIEARAVHDVPPTSDTLARLAQLDSVATEELRSLAPD